MINYDLDPEEMTIDQIADELVEMCEANPGQRNPSDGWGGGMNTSRINPDHHCLVAQFLVNHGVVLPAADAAENTYSIESLVECWLELADPVVGFLTLVQNAADGQVNGQSERWGELPRLIKETARDANDMTARVS